MTATLDTADYADTIIKRVMHYVKGGMKPGLAIFEVCDYYLKLDPQDESTFDWQCARVAEWVLDGTTVKPSTGNVRLYVVHLVNAAAGIGQ